MQLQLVFKETNYFIKTSSSHFQSCFNKSSPLHPSGLLFYHFFGLRERKKEPNGNIYNLLTAIRTWELGSILSPPQSKGILQNFKHLSARPMTPQAARKDLCVAGCYCKYKDTKWFETSLCLGTSKARSGTNKDGSSLSCLNVSLCVRYPRRPQSKSSLYTTETENSDGVG